MSWNEPGNDNKDPWSGRNDQKGPPDLDEAIRKLQEKLGSLFGGDNNGEEHNANSNPMKGFGVLAGGAALIWLSTGFYTVDEGNNGVETRFGKYVTTTQAGLNWHLPAPFERVDIVNVKQQRFIEVGYRSGVSEDVGSVPKEALMLTKDENIVDIRIAVQYQVNDAKKFLFNVENPAATLKQVTESAERGVIGSNTMDFALTEGRTEIVDQIKQEIQTVIDSYQSGIQITSVNLQDAQPPEQVQSAFEDAIKAREDQQRLINEAEAYANDVVPKARGAAARKRQEAEGYKQQVIAEAEGDVSRFSQLLTEYKKAPEVTRNRLYLEAMESVLSKANKVMVDVKNGNNLLYLPLDKIAQAASNGVAADVESEAVQPAATAPASVSTNKLPESVVRISNRGREERRR